jgi:hypothetical protein
MPVEPARPETDLLLPLPTGEQWHQHKIHTHYFGFSVPEAELFAFTYMRAHPAFPLTQGGVCIFTGMDNNDPLDMAYIDYQLTMPWPTRKDNTFTTANGLSIEIIEPGKTARLTYSSPDGATRFDVLQSAITPLFSRSFIMPGEELFHDNLELSHGGSEQFMHCTGELTLNGETYTIDCHHPRDRSWNQIRVEQPASMPPTGWTPMYFGDDLILNVTSSESNSTNPAWAGLYQPKDDSSNIIFGWIYSRSDDLARRITKLRRNVLEHHPVNHMATRQEIELEDENGSKYNFRGQAIACAVIPQWPNLGYRVSLYRWEDESGRTSDTDFQEMWYAPYQRLMRERALAGGAPPPPRAAVNKRER